MLALKVSAVDHFFLTTQGEEVFYSEYNRAPIFYLGLVVGICMPKSSKKVFDYLNITLMPKQNIKQHFEKYKGVVSHIGILEALTKNHSHTLYRYGYGIKIKGITELQNKPEAICDSSLFAYIKDPNKDFQNEVKNYENTFTL